MLIERLLLIKVGNAGNHPQCRELYGHSIKKYLISKYLEWIKRKCFCPFCIMKKIMAVPTFLYMLTIPGLFDYKNNKNSTFTKHDKLDKVAEFRKCIHACVASYI